MANLKERKIEGIVPDASGSATLEFGNEKGFLLPKKHKWIMPEAMKGWIALIPALIFLIVFMIYPIINAVLMSFINNFYWVGNSNSSFAIINYFAALENARSGIEVSWGISNYLYCLQDPLFLTALENTGIIVIISVPLTIIIALLIATCLNAIKPLKGLYQTIFFLPYVTNSIALGMVFNVMFSSGSAGLFNTFIGWFGIQPQSWLSDSASRWMMFVVIVVYSIWNGLAFKILVFMSGLATIDKQYYDAARIDGATKAMIFRRITIPLLSPQILYITITSFIGACKSYTQIISLFGGGQTDFGGVDGTNWITIVGYIYKYMNSTNEAALGSAAAGSIILLIIVLIITGIQFLVSRKRVYY
ncbi:MAG: sugar ABC transporter permease [Erysipelotrichaceae bacterium]|jgi:multiple sugar transport system permease protein|nr:sugar ABC transporter permease [Erysipelotrichaceae bacterium]